MPKITLSVEDIKSTLTMEAGWKPATLTAYTTEPSAKKDSINHFFHFRVENEPGDMRDLKYCVNDKNKKMFTLGMITVYEGISGAMVSEDKPLEIEPEGWIGTSCFVEVDKTLYNGRPQNSITAISNTKAF